MCTLMLSIMRTKYVKTMETLQQLAQIYRNRGLEVVETDQRIEGYDKKGKLRAIAEVKK